MSEYGRPLGPPSHLPSRLTQSRFSQDTWKNDLYTFRGADAGPSRPARAHAPRAGSHGLDDEEDNSRDPYRAQPRSNKRRRLSDGEVSEESPKYRSNEKHRRRDSTSSRGSRGEERYERDRMRDSPPHISRSAGRRSEKNRRYDSDGSDRRQGYGREREKEKLSARVRREEVDEGDMASAMNSFSNSLSRMIAAQTALSLASTQLTRLQSFLSSHTQTSTPPELHIMTSAKESQALAIQEVYNTTKTAQDDFVRLMSVCVGGLSVVAPKESMGKEGEKPREMTGFETEMMKEIEARIAELERMSTRMGVEKGGKLEGVNGHDESKVASRSNVLALPHRSNSPAPPTPTEPAPTAPPSPSASDDVAALVGGTTTSATRKPTRKMRDLLNSIISRLDTLSASNDSMSERMDMFENRYDQRESEEIMAVMYGLDPPGEVYGERYEGGGGWERLEQDRDPTGRLRGLVTGDAGTNDTKHLTKTGRDGGLIEDESKTDTEKMPHVGADSTITNPSRRVFELSDSEEDGPPLSKTGPASKSRPQHAHAAPSEIDTLRATVDNMQAELNTVKAQAAHRVSATDTRDSDRSRLVIDDTMEAVIEAKAKAMIEDVKASLERDMSTMVRKEMKKVLDLFKSRQEGSARTPNASVRASPAITPETRPSAASSQVAILPDFATPAVAGRTVPVTGHTPNSMLLPASTSNTSQIIPETSYAAARKVILDSDVIQRLSQAIPLNKDLIENLIRKLSDIDIKQIYFLSALQGLSVSDATVSFIKSRVEQDPAGSHLGSRQQSLAQSPAFGHPSHRSDVAPPQPINPGQGMQGTLPPQPRRQAANQTEE